MVDNLNKLATIFTKIRTPLSLAGLVILVLYAVYRQILSLKIFPTLSETSASVLLNSLVTGLFWLALVAIVLGVVSHFLSVFFKVKLARQGNMVLVDQQLLSQDKPRNSRSANRKRETN